LRVHPHVSTKRPQYVTAVGWVDLATGRWRKLEYGASGPINSDTSFAFENKAPYGGWNARQVTVGYDSKTWSIQTPLMECGWDGHAPCRVPGPPSSECGCDLDPFTDFSPMNPRVFLLGEATVDGKPTFHLRFVIVVGLDASTTDFWVDRSTYLPVHSQVFVPPSHGVAPRTTTRNFTGLPRNSASLALLTVVVPREFKRTANR
jgi:hypothetical protein